MSENKYMIVCEKKRIIYFADDKEIHSVFKAKRKHWKEIKKRLDEINKNA